MSTKQQGRDPYIDILKGIGIVSVVIGHSGRLFPWLTNTLATEFVYMYHLMIFLFVSGMVYNGEKHKDAGGYIVRQCKTAMTLYIGYDLAYILLHNLFVRVHLQEAAYYGVGEMVQHGLSALMLDETELLLGPLWFVPMFLVAKAIFGIGFSWAQNRKTSAVAHGAVIAVTAAVGLYSCTKNMYLQYQIQTALLCIPVIYGGVLFTKYRSLLKRWIHPVTGLLCAVLLVVCLKTVGFIQLSENQLLSPVLFYPVTAVGIWFCLCLGKLLQTWQISSRLFAYLGQISFHIMALHVTAFKVFDWGYGILTRQDWQTISRYPISAEGRGWIYVMAGVGLPAVGVYLCKLLRQKMKDSIIKNKMQ